MENTNHTKEMKIVLLEHQENSLGYSMARYTKFLYQGLRSRGHDVIILAPKLYLSGKVNNQKIGKWLKYIDQYIIFPVYLYFKIKRLPDNTIYALVDQALGMWMPILYKKNHIVHCHDFIALKSAMGIIKENPTGWTGKLYQRMILKGFSRANCFITISKRTQKELTEFLTTPPLINEQVYNALDPKFIPDSFYASRVELGRQFGLDLEEGYILHVGGNTFYKNRIGVIEIYTSWRRITNKSLPLLLIGNPPSSKICSYYEASPYKSDIHFLTGVADELLVKAYQGASVFVFPSLAEGFGFPIAEAMASGCPVITTNEPPMNEVGGEAAIYIDRCPSNGKMREWAGNTAKILNEIVLLSDDDRACLINKGLKNAKRFNEEILVEKVEAVYKEVLKLNPL